MPGGFLHVDTFCAKRNVFASERHFSLTDTVILQKVNPFPAPGIPGKWKPRIRLIRFPTVLRAPTVSAFAHSHTRVQGVLGRATTPLPRNPHQPVRALPYDPRKVCTLITLALRQSNTVWPPCPWRVTSGLSPVSATESGADSGPASCSTRLHIRYEIWTQKPELWERGTAQTE